MLKLMTLLLSAFASLFESTKLLEAEDLVVPIENLILYDERGLLMEPVSVPGRRPVPGAISMSSLKICGRRILGTR